MKKIVLSLMMITAMLIPVVLTSCSATDTPDEKPIVDNELSGSIKGTKTLDATIEYLITGPVIIEEGGVLNIPAGTVIKAQKGFNSYVLVLQGGKINAKGTASAPITFTADISNAQQGYWGGLIINGKAPLAGGEKGSTEINTSFLYGGDIANDNSGELTYVKLEYTGARSSADVEHNGLTLNGVGSGTKIENIFIPNSSDDGIEFFGGTVNVKNLLVVNSDDDMFDFTQGYTGTLENAYGIWEKGFVSSESDPRGIEADGNLDGNTPDQVGQSNFTVKNITIDLQLDPIAADHADFKKKSMQDVFKIRRGAKATITNALFKGIGTSENLIDFNDGKGNGDSTSSISYKSMLPAPTKELVKGTGDVTINESNTGCVSNIFVWTGYTGF
jgi:hypothetical protein